MITDEVIREIYKTNKKPPKDLSELNLDEVMCTLKPFHDIKLSSDDLSKAEVILPDLPESNPFRRFLVRSLHAIIEFDHMFAFVFHNHILFLGKKDNQLRVHFKQDDEEEENSPSFFKRLFRKKS